MKVNFKNYIYIILVIYYLRQSNWRKPNNYRILNFFIDLINCGYSQSLSSFVICTSLKISSCNYQNRVKFLNIFLKIHYQDLCKLVNCNESYYYYLFDTISKYYTLFLLFQHYCKNQIKVYVIVMPVI